MKKTLTLLLSILGIFLSGISYGAIQTASCGSMPSSSGCSACFRETTKLYTCNPYLSSCDKEGVTNMYDVASNVGSSGNLVMYDDNEGSIYFNNLQGTGWSRSAPQVLDMFQFPAAYISGRQNLTVGPSSAGYILGPGESVRWIEYKPNQWLRPDLAPVGTNGSSPAMRVDFIPRLYSSATAYTDHKQCVYYYVRFCGDGTPDTDRNEQCDDGNMISGDGCSNTCQTEAPNPLTCDNLTIVTTPATLTQAGGTLTATCEGTNETQYKFILKQGSTVINTVNYQNSNQATFSIPANSASSAKDYSVQCQVKNANETDKTSSACMKSLSVPGTNPVCSTLTVTTPATTNGGSVGYECQGVNATSYSVVVTAPGGGTLGSFTSATGNFTIPSTPTGTYNVACYINGQSSTPSSCQKTVVNTTPENPVCAGLDLTRYNTNDGRQVGFTCAGSSGVTSYSVRVTSPTGGLLNSFDTATGNFTIPNTPTGTYSVACYVNGQTSTPSICQKTVTHNPTVENPVCTNLSVTKNGTSVDYSCTGTGPITSYTIQKNGTNVSSNSSGSLYVGYGTHTIKCLVNNNITSSACEKTVTINEPEQPEPRIEVIKDDDDNHDDKQTLEVGDDARFSILVRNNGSEGLDNVTLDDPRAPECDRTSSQTRNYISAVGNRDTIFDPGESFTYTCRRDNVSMSTFPNNENRVCVAGRGRESGQSVDDCDTTRIRFDEENVCDFMRVDFDRIGTPRSHVEVSCSPTDGYRLGIVRNGVLQDRLQSSIGEFEFDLTPGRYSLTCLRDGEDRVQPECTKNITIQEEEKVGECRLRSSVRYGGAPLRTHLSCETPDSNDCRIGVTRNGKVWKTINDCDATLTFTQPGDYEAVCILDGDASQNCSTNVSVDNMTETPTGPSATIAMIMIALASVGSYMYYRRRKTA